ncbi:MAG: hypothetical protein ACQKBU_03390 [Verrucomicrobiales bacterium]
MSALEAKNLVEDTLVMFTSDNGSHDAGVKGCIGNSMSARGAVR